MNSKGDLKLNRKKAQKEREVKPTTQGMRGPSQSMEGGTPKTPQKTGGGKMFRNSKSAAEK